MFLLGLAFCRQRLAGTGLKAAVRRQRFAGSGLQVSAGSFAESKKLYRRKCKAVYCYQHLQMAL